MLKCNIKNCENEAVSAVTFTLQEQDNTHTGHFWLCKEHRAELFKTLGKLPDERTQEDQVKDVAAKTMGVLRKMGMA